MSNRKATPKVMGKIVKLFVEGHEYPDIARLSKTTLANVRKVISKATADDRELYARRKHGGRSR